MDNGFKIGELEFKLIKLDARKQFHVVRRLAPILGELGPILGKMSKSKAASEEQMADNIGEFLKPIMEGFGNLKEEDADRVLDALLSAVEMKQPTGNWSRVSNGSMIMFQDLEFPVLIQAAGRAFMFNLSGFFSALPKV